MNVDDVKPFIEASTNVIEQITGMRPQVGEVINKTMPYKSDNVLVLLGLTGDVQGSVVVSLSAALACKIASAMMGGFEVPELNEIAKSAICELCNMILGNSATIFSQKNICIDITPPTILTGENIELSVHKSVIMCIPLIFADNSKIEIDISYLDKQ